MGSDGGGGCVENAGDGERRRSEMDAPRQTEARTGTRGHPGTQTRTQMHVNSDGQQQQQRWRHTAAAAQRCAPPSLPARHGITASDTDTHTAEVTSTPVRGDFYDVRKSEKKQTTRENARTGVGEDTQTLPKRAGRSDIPHFLLNTSTHTQTLTDTDTHFDGVWVCGVHLCCTCVCVCVCVFVHGRAGV